MSQTKPIVVIGAGLAGLACLSELSRAGLGPLLLVERHASFGTQASAQNAGLIRSHASNPHTAALARRGARWWAQHRADLFRGQGSVLVGGDSSELMAGFRRDEHRWLHKDQLFERVGHRPSGAFRSFFNPLDGIADPQAAMQIELQNCQAAGAEIFLDCEASLIDGELFLNGKAQDFSAVVLAAGAWSSQLLDLPLQAFSRHLFRCLGGPLKPSSPWVWDLDEEFYFRSDGDSLLLSACDERVVAEPDPKHWPRSNPDEWGNLRSKVARRWPSLGELELVKASAGLRCLSPDDGFILGQDPRNTGIYWCTGLGGHGVTCAQPAARLAMATLTGASLDDEEQRLAKAHAAQRFATLTETWNG
ncbi:MAG: FAD-dependent oxidoreductase [Myxococcota bacterium]|nr:FAD-dependent oxidoreductase [Myxococcota bacterium]